MATATFYPVDASNGRIEGSAVGDWASAHDASTGSLNNSAETMGVAAQLSGATYYIQRCFASFDTSSLGAATITSAYISLFAAGTNNNENTTSIQIVAATPASDTAIVAGDYDQVGTTVFATIALSSWTATDGTENQFPDLSAGGLANINGAGYSKFGFRLAKDTDNSAPLGNNIVNAYTARYSGGNSRYPKLVVTYTPAGPANVKTVNGITMANVKTVNGIAKANVKTINGIA